MNCRRCNGRKNVAHYINDFFGGWFCPPCVDALVNEVADAYVGLPTVGDSAPPRDADREAANSVVSGRQLQEREG